MHPVENCASAKAKIHNSLGPGQCLLPGIQDWSVGRCALFRWPANHRRLGISLVLVQKLTYIIRNVENWLFIT
jgi:hypothetical protein